jgi:formylglycine-generating enzyme required for sulfatase activity
MNLKSINSTVQNSCPVDRVCCPVARVCSPPSVRFAALILLSLQLVAGCSPSTTPTSPSGLPPTSASSSSPVLPSSVPSKVIDPTQIAFCSIPAGSIRLGSVSSEPGRDPSMERLVTVSVSTFVLSECEITYAQWYAVMKPGNFPSSSLTYMPVTNITWYEATQFCELLTLKTGIEHRLPTEAEWEYACRAGSSEMLSVWNGNGSLSEAITAFHRGDSGKLDRGIKASCNIDTARILPVGRFPANRFGLRDMHGNCWEWISLENTLTEPPSPLHAPIRGGSAISTNVFECRAANRSWQHMHKPTESIGFRIVREQAP